MKRLAILLALLLAATGCDSSPDGSEDTPTLGTVSARINGDRYETRAGTAVLDSSGLQPMLTFASGDPRYGMAFTLFPFDGVDDYAFVDANTSGILRFAVVTGSGASYSTLRAGGGGGVDITRLGEAEVEGRFEFTAVTPGGEVLTVTDGRFNVALQRQ